MTSEIKGPRLGYSIFFSSTTMAPGEQPLSSTHNFVIPADKLDEELTKAVAKMREAINVENFNNYMVSVGVAYVTE